MFFLLFFSWVWFSVPTAMSSSRGNPRANACTQLRNKRKIVESNLSSVRVCSCNQNIFVDLMREYYHNETAPRNGVAAWMPPWPNELYETAHPKLKIQTCLRNQWIDIWRSSHLVLQVGIDSDWHLSRRMEWKNSWSKKMDFHSVILHCREDRFLLEPQAWLGTPIVLQLNGWAA